MRISETRSSYKNLASTLPQNRGLKGKKNLAESQSAPDTRPQYENSTNLIPDLYTGVAEQTFTDSPYVPETQLKPYNPDDLWQKTADYTIYDDMVNDDQINVCLQLKRDMVLGSGWDIVPSDDSQEEIKKFLDKALKDECEVPLEELLEEILSGWRYGFSLTEKIFKHNDEGKLVLKTLKTRHPQTWLIHTDERGNISRYHQRGANQDIDVDPKALIHYVNNRRFQNPYGTSDLRPAYAAWFVKRQVVRFYSIYLEKAASPTPVAKYDKNAPQDAINKIHNAIKTIQTKTALTIPKDIELEWLEAKSNGEAYSKAIQLFNMFIGRCLFVPDLLGFQGSETGGGSYSLGTEQIKIFANHIARRRSTLEKLVNYHIIRPMVVYNFGLVDSFPQFRLRPIDDKEALEMAKVWLEAVKGKTYKPSDEEINHFRKAVKFPEGDVEFHEPLDLMGGFGESDDDQSEGKTPPQRGAQRGKQADESQDSDKAKPKKTFAKRVYKEPEATYWKKVNFKALESHLDSYQETLMAEANPVIEKIYRDMFDQIQKKKILQNQRPERIETIKLKYLKELKQVIKQSLLDSFKDSKMMAQQELMKGNFRAPLPNEKFLEVLEQETFDYIGDWEYTVTKGARQALMEAIKDGKPLSSVIDFLETEGKDVALVSLERYSRTKFTEVMNRGRIEFFDDSGVVAAYQYSAILDDRTSDICAGLHGKVFKAGTEPVPPMHFNCRSVLVPITKYEEWEADDKVGSKDIDAFIEENKGTGFPRR